MNDAVAGQRRFHEIGNVATGNVVVFRQSCRFVDANAKLFTSARAITQHTDRRMNQLQADAAKDFDKRILPKPNDNAVESCRSKLSRHIAEHRRDTVVRQWEMSSGTYKY